MFRPPPRPDDIASRRRHGRFLHDGMLGRAVRSLWLSSATKTIAERRIFGEGVRSPGRDAVEEDTVVPYAEAGAGVVDPLPT
jgi:hypothetical protein